MTYSILHDIEIKTTSEELFDAISKPEHLNNWWTRRCKGERSKGEVYNFYFTEEFDWYGRVIEIAANKKFWIEMIESDEDWNSTKFGFEITELENNTCMLSFMHENWQTTNHHFRRTSYCWAMLLNGLKNYIEKGEIVPFEKRN